MFTGIVDHCGELLSIERGETLRFWIASLFMDLSLGESVAVDGVCLTVTDLRDNQFACELSPETLNITTAGTYKVGQSLNLERAMRFSDRISGHLVTGHVDNTLLISAIKAHQDFTQIDFPGVSEENQRYLIAKGSVAIDGVSLTVNQVYDDGFSVMLIPHTLGRTNLSGLLKGKAVNVEWDYLAKLAVQGGWMKVGEKTYDRL